MSYYVSESAKMKLIGDWDMTDIHTFNDFLTSMSGWVYDAEGCFGDGFTDADDTVSWFFSGNGIFGDFFTSFENNAIRKGDDEYKLGTQKAPLTKEAWDKLLSAMSDKKLSFDVTEEIDGEEGNRWKQTTNFSSKGKKLLYQLTQSESLPVDMDDLPVDELTEFFCEFIEEADEDEVRSFIEKKLENCTDIMYLQDFPDVDEGEQLEMLETFVDGDFIKEFEEKFEPEGDDWDEFKSQFEEEGSSEEEEPFWRNLSDQELWEQYNWKVNYEMNRVEYVEKDGYSIVINGVERKSDRDMTLDFCFYPELSKRYHIPQEFPFNISKWENVKLIAANNRKIARIKDTNELISMSDNGLNESVFGFFGKATDIAASWVDMIMLDETGHARTYLVNQEVDEDWKDLIKVAAGAFHFLGLKKDGTVIAAGDNAYSQCEVENWRDIVSIAARGPYSIGIKKDGTIEYAGLDCPVKDCSNWSNVKQIVAGENFVCGLTNEGKILFSGRFNQIDENEEIENMKSWDNIVSIVAGGWHVLGLKSDGTVVAAGIKDQGQCDVESWKDIKTICADVTLSFGIHNDGTVEYTGQMIDIMKLAGKENDSDKEEPSDENEDYDGSEEYDENDDDFPDYPTVDISELDFDGKVFVLTGEFQNSEERDREDIQRKIEAKGGRCTGAVSGKTNYLVIGDFGGAGEKKILEAQEQQKNRSNIKIISESTLFEFL